MAALELFHRIYTHAPDVFLTIGWRNLQVAHNAADVLSPEALGELDDLLAKLDPVKRRAWAVRRFASGDHWFGCVIVSYLGFEDASGRVGLLNHARIVRLAPEDPWFNPVPLIEEALAFPIDDVLPIPASERAPKYVSLLGDADAIEVEEMSPSLLDFDRKIVSDVLVAALSSYPSRSATRFVTPDVELTELALAWAALPAGLQQWSSFAVEANDGVPVDAIWSDQGTKPSKAGTKNLADCVNRYLDLLFDPSYDHARLARDMSVRSTLDLQQATGRATIEAGLPAATLRPQEKPEMVGRKKDSPQKADDSGIDAELAELDRNYQAMYRLLRAYVDKRLDAYETVRPAVLGKDAPAPAHDKAATERRRFAWRAFLTGFDWRAFAKTFDWRVFAMGAIVMALVIFGTRPGSNRIDEKSDTSSATGTNGTTDTSATTATSGTTVTTGTIATTTTNATPVLDYKPVHDLIATCTKEQPPKQKRSWAVCLADFSTQNPKLFAVIVDRMKGDAKIKQPIQATLKSHSDRLHDRDPEKQIKARAVLRPLLYEYVIEYGTNETFEGNLTDEDKNDRSKAILEWIAKQGQQGGT